jgi:hypothetical protein
MTWVARLEQDGVLIGTIYQAADGSFFLRRPDQAETEPLTELEVRRFLVSAIERSEIEDACDRLFETVAGLGVATPSELKRQIVERTHKKAREAGLTRTGSAPNLTKFVR